ncbi:hypothetical protein ISCGN_016153 [Ixodes scapularis]
MRMLPSRRNRNLVRSVEGAKSVLENTVRRCRGVHSCGEDCLEPVSCGHRGHVRHFVYSETASEPPPLLSHDLRLELSQRLGFGLKSRLSFVSSKWLTAETVSVSVSVWVSVWVLNRPPANLLRGCLTA